MRYPLLLASFWFTQSALGASAAMCLAVPEDPTTPASTTYHAPASNASVADILGWVPMTNLCNECGGYFSEPRFIHDTPNPPDISSAPMNITATGPSVLSESATSSLEGNVTITQPGRQVNADKISMSRDPETGEVNRIDLEGNVRVQESGKLLVGDHSQLDVTNKVVSVDNAVYHIARPATTGPTDAWGTAKQATRNSQKMTTLRDATYTTCAPTDPSWHLQSKNIDLNQQTGRGTAKNTWIYAGKVPVFYLPYFNFPIDKSRYSGFLYPGFGYSSSSGSLLTIPYYFNLAPNYDDTLTLSGMSKRGVLFNNLFRYLTPANQGTLELSFLPNDNAFSDFKNTAAAQYPANSTNTPYLNELNNDSSNRAFIAFKDNTRFNPHWSSSLDLNYVTDDYYFQDISTGAQAIGTDQLLNQGDVNYQSEHWQFLARVQAYQTLHRINQSYVMDQYQRLPQLDLSANYPEQAHGLDYTFNSELVNFQHANDFVTSQAYPTGTRFHLNPQVSQPHVTDQGFFTPSLAFDITQYNVNNNGTVNSSVSPAVITPNSDPTLSLMRALPIFNIDSGLYFERQLQLGHGYTQTLEPRLFYLFVPQNNQNNIPVFDTTLPPFDVNQLFRTNRFIGYDRVGDANQLSMGLTSRMLDGFTGEDKLDASIGGIYYFHRRTVCLNADCSDDPNVNYHTSPIATQLFYHLNSKVGVIGNAAWNPNTSQMDNDSVGIQYSPDVRRTLNLSYGYVRNGDPLTTDPTDTSNSLHRVGVGASWPLTMHWSALANWNYNISHNHPQMYLYGLEYDACCWAVRLVASNTLQSEDSSGNTTFNKAYYVQFLLKGLGVVGNSDASDLLKTAIPGYYDPLKGKTL
jgi:LPS-assembly protein